MPVTRNVNNYILMPYKTVVATLTIELISMTLRHHYHPTVDLQCTAKTVSKNRKQEQLRTSLL